MLPKRASFFNHALSADPGNVEALVGSGSVNLIEAALSFVADPVAAFAAAEDKLTKALASVPDHALGHTWLGFVDILTKRAPQGIAECEHGLALDRNLASAHALIGQAKIFIGRAEETEAHVAEAQRLSPCDILGLRLAEYGGSREASSRQLRAGSRVVSTIEGGQPKFWVSVFQFGGLPGAA